MASHTSKSVSNTSGSEETQYHLSYCFFSLTTDVNFVSLNPQVPTAQRLDHDGPGVSVHFIISCLWFCDSVRIDFFSHMKMILSPGDTCYCMFFLIGCFKFISSNYYSNTKPSSS